MDDQLTYTVYRNIRKMQLLVTHPWGVMLFKVRMLGIRAVSRMFCFYPLPPPNASPLIITKIIFSTFPAIGFRPSDWVLNMTRCSNFPLYLRAKNATIIIKVHVERQNGLVMMPAQGSNLNLLQAIASFINSQWFTVLAHDLLVTVWFVGGIPIVASVCQKILGTWLLTGVYTGPALWILLGLLDIPFVRLPAIMGAPAVNNILALMYSLPNKEPELDNVDEDS